MRQGWTCATLGDIADVQLGKMLDKKKTGGSVLRYLRNINVRWGSIDTSDLLEMPFKSHELERYSLEPGDVLVCEGGEPGRCAVWSISDPTIKYQKALHRVRMEGGILPLWLVFHLYFDAQRGALSKSFTGTTIKHLPREAFREYDVHLAPLPEQHRIVEAIESYFTRLDDAVATLERVQRNLKRYRASVLKAAVEGRLVPTEAELARAEGRDYEPASVLLERILAERRRRWEENERAKMKSKGKAPTDDKWRAKYEEPISPNAADLSELPEGWSWVSVDQLEQGDRRSGYGVLVPGDDVPDGVPLVRVGDIKGGSINSSKLKRISRDVADRFAKTYLKGGEVLLTLVGTVGRTAVVPADLAGSNVARAVGVIPVSELVEPHWIEYWFRSPATRHRMAGKAHEVARKTLNLEDVRAAVVAVPPRSEQIRIREAIEDHASIIDSVDRQNEISTHRLARLRQSILKWAFEGRLVDQDPTDEPASVLLERIKAERATSSAAGRTRSRSRRGATSV